MKYRGEERLEALEGGVVDESSEKSEDEQPLAVGALAGLVGGNHVLHGQSARLRKTEGMGYRWRVRVKG